MNHNEENLKAFYEKELSEKMFSLGKEINRYYINMFLGITFFFLPYASSILIFIYIQRDPYNILFAPHFALVDLGINPVLSGSLFSIYYILTSLSIYKSFNAKDNCKSAYKSYIVESIINFINPDFNYSPDCGIAEYDYYYSNIFKQHNIYTSDDLIEGSFEGFDFKLAEIHTALEIHSDRSRCVERIFDGLFMIIDLKKELKHQTVITYDHAENFFGKVMGQALQKLTTINKDETIIKLEDPEFENIFKVLSTDQNEARTILTPIMMEKMVDIYKSLNNQSVCFSFDGSKVHIAISINNRNHKSGIYLMEPPKPFSTKKAQYQHAKDTYNLINIPFMIAKGLKENSNLWK